MAPTDAPRSSKWLSRHFLLTVTLIGLSTALLFKHMINGDAWVAAVSAATGLFRAGDAADTWIREGRDP